jgi:hypothetical protein
MSAKIRNRNALTGALFAASGGKLNAGDLSGGAASLVVISAISCKPQTHPHNQS